MYWVKGDTDQRRRDPVALLRRSNHDKLNNRIVNLVPMPD